MKQFIFALPFLFSSMFFLLLAFLFISGCSAFKGYTPDNPAEEFVEEIIKAETGLDLDLSPGSPEAL